LNYLLNRPDFFKYSRLALHHYGELAGALLDQNPVVRQLEVSAFVSCGVHEHPRLARY
jgi:hypothetical protein